VRTYVRPLFERSIYPLALMEFADRVPIKRASFTLVTYGGLFLAFGGDHVVHHVCCALTKLESKKLLCFANAPCSDEGLFYALANIPVRKPSPVFIIAQIIRASLLARATGTSQAGLRARRATSQSRKAPLRLPATREPTRSPLRNRLPRLLRPV
jgi:hypothetical protein